LSKDGATVLAYHPQKDFPYEHSRPLPQPVDDLAQYNDSPLKVGISKAFAEKTTSKQLTTKDLEIMFSEARGFFREQPQERKRKEVAEWKRQKKAKTLRELPDD